MSGASHTRRSSQFVYLYFEQYLKSTGCDVPYIYLYESITENSRNLFMHSPEKRLGKSFSVAYHQNGLYFIIWPSGEKRDPTALVISVVPDQTARSRSLIRAYSAHYSVAK